MTALNLRIYDHVGFVLTDGAAYSADGLATMTGLVNKVCIAPDLGSAIACSGDVSLPEAFAAGFRNAGCTSFDDCAAAFSTVAADLQLRVAAMFPDRVHLFQFRAALIGWSDSAGRVQAFLVANYDEMVWPPRMRPAFEADEVKSFESPQCGGFVTMLTPENVEDHGLELMNRQRRTAVEMQGFGTARAFTVGGFVQLTTVSQDGLRTRVLHRWPDKIGEPINPAG